VQFSQPLDLAAFRLIDAQTVIGKCVATAAGGADWKFLLTRN